MNARYTACPALTLSAILLFLRSTGPLRKDLGQGSAEDIVAGKPLVPTQLSALRTEGWVGVQAETV